MIRSSESRTNSLKWSKNKDSKRKAKVKYKRKNV